ncbi:hypothetical protein CRG98_023791 [Punica granatum]|uniref:DUF7963 domain-containing protein n=1 Tax=Punica granatum TaxID=22663 RepID=A0A2I0JJU4_PUNGR|nr:hypothetical protein CRG98_023791 [Punica granatum]
MGMTMGMGLWCSLCDSVFSASNPSRTASEHLKRGTCPNFASSPNPISIVSPVPPPQSPHRQHCLPASAATEDPAGLHPSRSFWVSPTAPPQHQHHQLVLSGAAPSFSFLLPLLILPDLRKRIREELPLPGIGVPIDDFHRLLEVARYLGCLWGAMGATLRAPK